MWLGGLKEVLSSGKGSAFLLAVAALFGAHELGVLESAKWPVSALGVAFMLTRAVVEWKHGPPKE